MIRGLSYDHPEVQRRMAENPGLGAVQAANQIKMEGRWPHKGRVVPDPNGPPNDLSINDIMQGGGKLDPQKPSKLKPERPLQRVARSRSKK